MTEYLFDASAWIEYLRGSSRASKIRFLVGKARIFTSAVSLAEVISKVLREGGPAEVAAAAIRSASVILPLGTDEAIEAGKAHAEGRKKHSKLSLADAIVIVTARKSNTRIVTFDTDFAGTSNVLLMK